MGNWELNLITELPIYLNYLKKNKITMARIVNAHSAEGWKKQHDGIKAKHDADGAASPLKGFLAENGIDLNDDNHSLKDAVTHDGAFITASGKAEEYSLERDHWFNPVFKRLKNMAQFNKAYYKNNVQKLIDWGLQVDGEGRIVYPASFEERYKLVVAFYEKHISYPMGTSPLDGYLLENSVDMDKLKKDADNANKANDNFSVEDKKSEEESKARDLLMLAPVSNTKAIGQFLKKHFSSNPKKLGQYGIRVDDSPQGVKVQRSKLAPGTQKTIVSAHIGGLFTNTGATILKLYAGKKVSGKSITLEAGKEWIILKGFSAITVVNTNSEKTGSFSVDINK